MPDECRILQLVLFEERLYVFSERGVRVDFDVGRFAVVSRVDGVYGPFENARERTGEDLVTVWIDSVERMHVLSYTLVIPLASEQAMYDHNWISFGFA